MKLIIADDHVLVGQAVASALQGHGDYEVRLVTSLPDVLSRLTEESFDIVMLDLKMPGMVGLPSVKQVIDAAKSAKVVLFSGQVDRRLVSDCLEIGVRGHIPKDMPLRSLDSVLQLINSGQTFVPVVGRMAADDTVQQGALSDRELHILRLAAEGMTNKEIARDIAVSEVSVKMHMRNVCRKLGARNRAHAAIISRELMLI